MRDKVEQALQRGNAPAGYVVTDRDDGAAAVVEYPDDPGVRSYVGMPSVPGSYSLQPGPNLRRCEEILQSDGYATGWEIGADHERLVVRRS